MAVGQLLLEPGIIINFVPTEIAEICPDAIFLNDAKGRIPRSKIFLIGAFRQREYPVEVSVQPGRGSEFKTAVIKSVVLDHVFLDEKVLKRGIAVCVFMKIYLFKIFEVPLEILCAVLKNSLRVQMRRAGFSPQRLRRLKNP